MLDHDALLHANRFINLSLTNKILFHILPNKILPETIVHSEGTNVPQEFQD